MLRNLFSLTFSLIILATYTPLDAQEISAPEPILVANTTVVDLGDDGTWDFLKLDYDGDGTFEFIVPVDVLTFYVPIQPPICDSAVYFYFCDVPHFTCPSDFVNDVASF